MTEGQADDDGREHRPAEAVDDPTRCDRAGARGQRRGHDDEGRCVVHQTLALEHGDDALADAGPADDRRGDGVGRADDGAQGDGGGKSQPGHERVEDSPDDHRRERHEQHRQGGDRAQVASELGHRHLDGRGVEEPGQDDLEDDVGVRVHGGHGRYRCDPGAEDQEQHRGDDARPIGQSLAHRDDEQGDDGDGEHDGHGLQDPRAGRVGGGSVHRPETTGPRPRRTRPRTCGERGS